MSENLEDLLAREGHEDVDALMGWARERAADLVRGLDGDDELGPLLDAGGRTAAAPPSGQSEAEVALHVEQTELAARREASNAAPLPPIPVAAPAVPTAELDVDEIEELDMEELEMFDEDESDDEPTDVGPAPQPPGPPAAEAGGETEPETEPEDTNSFGPPDGNEHVPEWKAALLSTQTETDQEAAQRVKEASTAGPLPEMPSPDDAARLSARLEAEDDEISQHSVDLSDLDVD